MKMIYWYNGRPYYYCEIEEMEERTGVNITGLYPKFTTMQKINIVNGIENLNKYYGVRDFHLEFYPTNNLEFTWVADDPNNRGAMKMSLI